MDADLGGVEDEGVLTWALRTSNGWISKPRTTKGRSVLRSVGLGEVEDLEGEGGFGGLWVAAGSGGL